MKGSSAIPLRPSSFPNTAFIHSWKTSPLQVSPNGSLFHLYFVHRVLTVLSLLLLSSSFTCQNPLRASRMLKWEAPLALGMASSLVLTWYGMRCIALFRSRGFRKRRIVLFGFLVTTVELTDGVIHCALVQGYLLVGVVGSEAPCNWTGTCPWGRVYIGEIFGLVSM